MQATGGITYQRGKPGFNVHVNVFEPGVDGKVPCLDFTQYLIQASGNCHTIGA